MIWVKKIKTQVKGRSFFFQGGNELKWTGKLAVRFIHINRTPDRFPYQEIARQNLWKRIECSAESPITSIK